MDIRPIRTERDYDWALAEITHYFDNQPQPGTPEADRFDVLAALIEAYENIYWKIEAPDPVEAIKEHMASFDKSQADLAKLLGSRSRASEVLHRRRRVSIDMVHRLSTEWHIPAEVLVAPYHLLDADDEAETRFSARAKIASKSAGLARSTT